jgi:hypothetical protein
VGHPYWRRTRRRAGGRQRFCRVVWCSVRYACFERTILGDDARMEYHFSIDASATDTPCAFVADQCTGDPLDWPSFDRVSSAIGPVTAPPAAVTRTLVPAPVTFKGMAARRYWQLEPGVYCESDFLERTRLAARSISRPTIPRTRTGGPQL